MPKVAIIVLNWNGLNNTIECLEFLKKINYPNFKIILVDNGSENKEAEILEEKYKDLIFLIKNKENLGFAKGNNQGIEEALKDPEVKWILTLNNDTIVEKNFIDEAIEKLENIKCGEKIGMMAMKVMNYYGRDEIDSLGIQFTQGALAFNNKTSQSPLFCPCAAAALYSRELLEKVEINGDYFDSDFFSYSEDLDLGFRALLLGFKPVLAEKSIVYHKGSASTKIMSDLAVYYSYRNIIFTLVKNLPFTLFLKFLPKIIFAHLAIILLWILRGKPFLILKSYMDAFLNLRKMFEKRKIIQKSKVISNKELEKYFTKGIFSEFYLRNLKI